MDPTAKERGIDHAGMTPWPGVDLWRYGDNGSGESGTYPFTAVGKRQRPAQVNHTVRPASSLERLGRGSSRQALVTATHCVLLRSTRS